MNINYRMRRKEREITATADIEAVISRCDVCRIAFSDDNAPYIVTMNFGYSGGTEKILYFHSAGEGRKISMIGRNNYVCFEMDTDHSLVTGAETCDFTMKYSSVVGWGRIYIITDEKEKEAGMNSIMHHYTNQQEFIYFKDVFERTTVLKLVIETMTGKSIL